MKRRTVLITDDVELNRAILREILRSDYHLLEAADGVETMEVLNTHSDSISAVLLDVIMPNMDGFEVLQKMHEQKILQKIPVLLVSSDNTVEFERKGYQNGAFDFIHKPFDGTVVKARLKRAVDMYESKNHLEQIVDDQTEILEKQVRQLKRQESIQRQTNSNIVDVMSSIVEFRSLESGQHVKRMKFYSRVLANKVMTLAPRYGLTPKDVDMISEASALHDMGKIAIPDSVLLKPGKLTPEEFSVMKTHAEKGAEIVEELEWAQDDATHQLSYDICKYHHEKYDGKGYPEGLKGDEIPIAAQIVSMADVFDALTSKRVYKKAYSTDQAYKMIMNGECGAFSDLMKECLTECLDELKQVKAEHEDAK
jgi:Response regulator containing a CheY-like receiver domain and an HD-GYP domain